MPITLQFSYLPGIPSALITWFSHGAGYSHVDAVLPDGRLIGARSDKRPVPGVQRREPGYAPFSRVFRVSLPTVYHQDNNFWQFLNQQIGKPYDKTAIMAFAVDRDWRDPSAWFCSELIAAALEACSWFPFALARGVNKIAPDDLLLAISARMDVNGV